MVINIFLITIFILIVAEVIRANRLLEPKRDPNRLVVNNTVYYKGQFLNVKASYPVTQVAGEQVEVCNFHELYHYVTYEGGLPVVATKQVQINDPYPVLSTVFNGVIPIGYLEVLPDDPVNKVFRETISKKAKKGGVIKMPRIFRWAIYLAVTIFIWKFMTALDINLILRRVLGW